MGHIGYPSSAPNLSWQGFQLELRSLFAELLEARRHDLVSFGAAISAAALGRQWEVAGRLLSGMPEKELAPNQVPGKPVVYDHGQLSRIF